MVVLQRSAVYCSCREAGKTARCYKPFTNLRVAQLREELHARGIFSTDCRKKEQQILTSKYPQRSTASLKIATLYSKTGIG